MKCNINFVWFFLSHIDLTVHERMMVGKRQRSKRWKRVARMRNNHDINNNTLYFINDTFYQYISSTLSAHDFVTKIKWNKLKWKRIKMTNNRTQTYALYQKSENRMVNDGCWLSILNVQDNQQQFYHIQLILFTVCCLDSISFVSSQINCKHFTDDQPTQPFSNLQTNERMKRNIKGIIFFPNKNCFIFSFFEFFEVEKYRIDSNTLDKNVGKHRSKSLFSQNIKIIVHSFMEKLWKKKYYYFYCLPFGGLCQATVAFSVWICFFFFGRLE